MTRTAKQRRGRSDTRMSMAKSHASRVVAPVGLSRASVLYDDLYVRFSRKWVSASRQLMPVNGPIGGDRLAVLPVAIVFNLFALQQINFEKRRRRQSLSLAQLSPNVSTP